MVNNEKTKPSGKLQSILLLVVVCFLVAIPTVSAFNWTNLVAYYKLDETSGTTVVDSTGINDGTLGGSSIVQGEDGIINTGYYADIEQATTVSTDFILTGTLGITGDENRSISAWIKYNGTKDLKVFSTGDACVASASWDVLIGSGGYLKTGSSGGSYDSANIVIPDDDTFHHIAVVYSGGGILTGSKLFVDGNEITATSSVGNDNVPTATDNYNAIGGSYCSNSPSGMRTRWDGFLDEVAIYDKALSSIEISELYYNYSPTITLIYPVNDTIISDVGTNFSVSGNNISAIGNWTNVTYNIWYDNSTVFNSTTVDFTDNETFNQTLIFDGFTNGNYMWNAEACYTNITGSSCISAIANYTFSVGATVSSSIFNNNTYETSSEIFEIVVELVEGSQLSLARLIYNGTNYTISNISSSNNTYTLTRIIDIPLINSTYQSNSFYWSFIYNGGETQTLGSNSQNVSSIFLSQCNATYTTQSLSFIYFDELNQTLLNAMTYPTSLLLNFKYWLGSGDIKKTYTFQELSSSLNSFQFCISENETFYTDMDLQYYTATDYSERSYYFRNYTLNNVSNDITLYTLLKTEATKFSINIKQGVNVFPDAVVAVWKYFVGLGNYRVVMIGLTDDKGKFSANLDLDQSYNFTINKNNYDYGGFLKQATCLESPCEIDINIEELALSGFADLLEYFAQNIEITDESLWNNRTSKMVSVDFMDKLGTASYWRLWVYMNNYNNDSVITICDEKEYASTGTLSCNYSAYSGDIVAKLYISRSPEKLVEFINFVNTNAPEIFGASAILASIIILCVILFSGTVNPVIALVEIPFALVILKFIGFIPFDWSWIAGLTIFILWIAHKVNT